MINEAKTWTVEIYLAEEDGHTHARAELRNRDRTLSGRGVARRRPTDREVPEVGDELAAARALGDLSQQLTAAALDDITAFVNS